MSPSRPSQHPRKEQLLKAKLDRYEARTAMEIEERRAHLLLSAAERRVFLAITVVSALLAIGLAVVGALQHNPLWYPGGTFGLTVISGGAAIKLHFLRGGEGSP
jgi:hypothetical protein